MNVKRILVASFDLSRVVLSCRRWRGFTSLPRLSSRVDQTRPHPPSSLTRNATMANANAGSGDKTYFEQQRQLLIGDVAAVGKTGVRGIWI